MNDIAQTTQPRISHQIAGGLLSLLILAGLAMGIARHMGALSCSGAPIATASLPESSPSP